MKIKVLSRREAEHSRERKSDVVKLPRNVDPALHAMGRAREYARALVAVKMDRLFAKPLMGALDGHRDAVHCMALDRTNLTRMFSGAQDGELRCWDLASRRTIWSVAAHSGFVRGLCVNVESTRLFSCGADKTIKLWRTNPGNLGVLDDDDALANEDEDEDDDDDDHDHDHDGKEGAGAAGGAKGGRQRRSVRKKLASGWRPDPAMASRGSASARAERFYSDLIDPLQSFTGEHAFVAIDHHRGEDMFATASVRVDLWSSARPEPIRSLVWGADSVHSVKFNPVEHQLLASCSSDRSVVLYDVRARTPVRRMVMQMSSNQLSWNPMESYVFTVANEDNNCYTFDVRKLDAALCIHSDHQAAVMSLDYAPTGREFVTGSYDRTVRIFRSNEGRSREIYHTKRMRRVMSVAFTLDNNFVLSGSDDFNIRLWKARASQRLGTMVPRQRDTIEYGQALIRRFDHVPDVRRINRHRIVPKSIEIQRRQAHESLVWKARKEKRVRAHSKNPTNPEPARKKRVIKVE